MKAANRVNRITAQLQQAEPSNPSIATSFTGSGGVIGTKSADDVVIISAKRTAIGKAKKGSFKDTQPDDLLKAVLEGVVNDSGISHSEIGDVVVGNVQLSDAYAGPARMAQLRAGFPVEVPLNTVNRQCSSGLQVLHACSFSFHFFLIVYSLRFFILGCC